MAAKWGGNIDMAQLPTWSHPYVMDNVLYTRNFLAANKEVLQDDGSVDLNAAGNTPLMIPQDLSVALSNAASASTSATSSVSATSSQAAASSTAAATNNAMSTSSSKLVIALVVLTTFYML